MPIKPDDLIPPDSDLAHLLMQWSESTDERTWSIANLTNELVEELSGGIATKQDIYRAVAARCKGREPNTIRRWAETAADFDKKTQKKYAQLLSFNHFKVARRLHKEGLTPYINYALEWCVEGNDDKLSAGRFHTVGEMLANFLPAEEGHPLRVYWGKVKEKLYDLMILEDNDIKRAHMTDNWKELDDVIATLDKPVEV